MGVVAGLVEFPVDRWSNVLSTLSTVGIAVGDEGIENGTQLFRCRRNKCELCLEFVKVSATGQQRVMVYHPALFLWRRPLGMWRLHRDVRSAVYAVGGRCVVDWSEA